MQIIHSSLPTSEVYHSNIFYPPRIIPVESLQWGMLIENPIQTNFLFHNLSSTMAINRCWWRVNIRHETYLKYSPNQHILLDRHSLDLTWLVHLKILNRFVCFSKLSFSTHTKFKHPQHPLEGSSSSLSPAVPKPTFFHLLWIQFWLEACHTLQNTQSLQSLPLCLHNAWFWRPLSHRGLAW